MKKFKFVKKPLMVEAYQTDREMLIDTLEGTMKADVGDWIITGIKGEEYPCKPDIFHETYDIYLGEEIPITHWKSTLMEGKKNGD
jgi:hypothetical protein